MFVWLCWLGLVIFLPLDWDAWRIISSSSSVDILLFSWFSSSPWGFFFFFLFSLSIYVSFFFVCLGKYVTECNHFFLTPSNPFQIFSIEVSLLQSHWCSSLSLSLITFIIKVIITGSIFTSQAVNCPHFVSFRWRLNSKKICGEQKLNCPKFKSCQSVGCHSASLVA